MEKANPIFVNTKPPNLSSDGEIYRIRFKKNATFHICQNFNRIALV